MEINENSTALRKKLLAAAIFMLLGLLTATVTTFAWYIYHTSGNTIEVQLTAGSSASLQISNQVDGEYGTSTSLRVGNDDKPVALSPVSTDWIDTSAVDGGFQAVETFIDGDADRAYSLASVFGKADTADFYHTQLFLRTSYSGSLPIYVSQIGESGTGEKLAKALRVGLVVEGGGQFFFELDSTPGTTGKYNTEKGYHSDGSYHGEVLKHDPKDGENGEVVTITTYDQDNMCVYDRDTGKVSLKSGSVKICDISGNEGNFGDPKKIDVYVWLEGCDPDCYEDIRGEKFENLSISFAGYQGS